MFEVNVNENKPLLRLVLKCSVVFCLFVCLFVFCIYFSIVGVRSSSLSSRSPQKLNMGCTCLDCSWVSSSLKTFCQVPFQSKIQHVMDSHIL